MWWYNRNCSVKLNSKQILRFCSNNLKPAYVPSDVESTESECYNYFRPKTTSKKPFTMILPPPNITGDLHLGHALTATIQDVLIRWKRMEGVECVWIPGIDHAGIATQVIVEKLLWKESRQTRHDIGCQAFQQKIWKWKEEKSKIIEGQLRRLGASLDWHRGVFTMDPVQSVEVSRAFVKLFEADLIYRADRLVNWSCRLRSAISDIEVDHVEVDGPTRITVPGYDKPVGFGNLYFFAYKFHESEEEIVVATTRPETIPGDVAVAVSPRDGRYARHIGRYLWHPFRNQTIPIICDDFVDPEFGTGAVKVTPAHDAADFGVGKRHALSQVSVIDEDGLVEGVPRFKFREEILQRLEAQGLARGRRDHRMKVPVCGRSGDVVELLVKPQWFVRCEGMAREAVRDVQEGRLKMLPTQFQRVWLEWLENVRDWCISRQLSWGHRIPAYSCSIPAAPSIWVAAENPAEATRKASAIFNSHDVQISQDNDVLDTWFSSALLPFSCWSEKDRSANYPLSMMETGHDILFFWVARMVMLGRELTGRLPFEEVLLHGIICDVHGRKMSKSLGNVVRPEDVIQGSKLKDLEESARASLLSPDELSKALQGQQKMFPQGIPECGADALRFTLCSHNIKSGYLSTGHFIHFDVQECHANRLFCNKIWQATKYTNGVLENTPVEWLGPVGFNELGPMDRWILSRLTNMIEKCRIGLENYDFHVVARAIKDFFYYQFCDIYLETTKRAFKLSEQGKAAGHCWTLTTCLDTALRAMSPLMPRLAQHLHSRLTLYPGSTRSFYYPQGLDWRDTSLEDDVSQVLEVVIGIRRMKKIFGITWKHQPRAYLISSTDFFDLYRETVQDLAGLHELTIVPDCTNLMVENTINDRLACGVVVHLDFPQDLRKSLELDLPKLEEQRRKLIIEIEKMNKMISADNYKIKVTQEAQKVHSKKLAVFEEKLERIDYIRGFSQQ